MRRSLRHCLLAILACGIMVVVLPPLLLLLLRMLFVGAPIVLIGGALLFVYQMLKGE